MKLIAEVVIPNYVRKIQISKSRQATYYKLGEKLPSRYGDKIGINYMWVTFGDGTYLCNSKKEPIVKNKDSVGTPKYLIINGQDLHTLRLKDYQRSAIIKAIKAQMIPEVAKLEPITEFPLRIMMELHDTFIDAEYNKDIGWDIDNRVAFHTKMFPDVLQGCLIKDKNTKKLIPTSKVIIPNDSRKYITQPPVPIFYPIEDANQRKLVFKIFHDERECINKSNWYSGSKTK